MLRTKCFDFVGSQVCPCFHVPDGGAKDSKQQEPHRNLDKQSLIKADGQNAEKDTTGREGFKVSACVHT